MRVQTPTVAGIAALAALALLAGTTAPAAAADVAGVGSTQSSSAPAATGDSGQASSAPSSAHPATDVGPSGGLPRTLPTVRSERLGRAQWGLTAIGAEGAWGITRGAGVIVAVLDSGVDDTHPDLVGRVLPATDLVVDGRLGDPFGHGTRIAGIIAAALDNAGIAGVASEVRILPIRVLAADGEGEQHRTARGIRAAVAAGAQVINLSLSSQTESQAQADAIRYALDQGVTVVAAAGNRREQGSPTVYPAAYPGVIGVSSVGPRLRASAFASRGPFIDLVAPGERVITTQAGGGWGSEGGTSIAAAFVTAGVALVRAANPTLSPAQVEEILLTTARNLGPRGRDDAYGHGLLRVDRAVRAAAGLAGGLGIGAAVVTVRSTSNGSKLGVDVDPELSAGGWAFRIQRQRVDGSWYTLRTRFRTRGALETRIVDLPAGTYRVRVPAQMGLDEATSVPVTLLS